MKVTLREATLDELLDAPNGPRTLSQRRKVLEDRAVYHLVVGVLALVTGTITITWQNPFQHQYSWQNTELPLQILGSILGITLILHGWTKLKKWQHTNRLLHTWDQRIAESITVAKTAAATYAEAKHGIQHIPLESISLQADTWHETTLVRNGVTCTARIGYPDASKPLHVQTSTNAGAASVPTEGIEVDDETGTSTDRVEAHA